MSILARQKITWVGVLVTLLTSLIFILWTGNLSSHWAIYSSCLVGCAVQLAIGEIELKWNSYALALLGSLFGIAILCFIPYAIWFLGLFGIFLLFRLVKSLKHNLLDPISLFVAAIYSAVIFGSLSRNIGDPFVNQKIAQLSLNPDTLFFASMSTMFKNYFQVATGMHGLYWVHYHFLSSAFYGILSKLLLVEPFETYGYTNFILFCPLLITGFLRVLFQSTETSPRSKWLMHFILIGGPLFCCFNWKSVNEFISESYLMGLLLLTGSLSILYKFISEEKVTLLERILFLIYLPFVFIGKISVGFILWCASGAVVFFHGKTSRNKKLIFLGLIGIFGLIGYFWARTIPIPGLEVKYAPGWYQRQVGEEFFLRFIVKQFPYFFLLMPAYYEFKKQNLLTRPIQLWLGVIAISTAIGFAGLNLTIDSSGYYFSNVLYFMALPMFGIVLGYLPENLSPVYLWRERETLKPLEIRSSVIVYFFSLSMIFYALVTFPSLMEDAKQVRMDVITHPVPENDYQRLLKIVHDDTDSRLMVYIPKTEKAFWEDASDPYSPWKHQQCIRMPFYIPILSGKPAIFGLPDPARECYTFHRGYETYSPAEYAASAKPDYSDTELCTAVLGKGFHGYYRIAEKAAVKHLCTGQ
jgi:hypothetical protein